MALKDWKQIINSGMEKVYDNLKTEERVQIVNHTKGTDVNIFPEGESSTYAKTQKEFKTKSQAIAFARGYMRSH